MQRHLRLRHADDFRRLRERGAAQRHPLLLLSFTPNGQATNRYGFVTSKRLGNAVTRNRTRRRLRAIMHALHPTLTPGYDIVIIARQPLTTQPYTDLARIVSELLRRAKLFVDEG